MCANKPIQDYRIHAFIIGNVLNIIDAITTGIGLNLLGVTERNVFAVWLIQRIGLVTAGLFKIFLVGMIMYWLYLKWDDKQCRFMAYGILLILLLIVINNLTIIFMA